MTKNSRDMTDLDKQIIRSTLYTLTELLYDIKISLKPEDKELLESYRDTLLKNINEELFKDDKD